MRSTNHVLKVTVLFCSIAMALLACKPRQEIGSEVAFSTAGGGGSSCKELDLKNEKHTMRRRARLAGFLYRMMLEGHPRATTLLVTALHMDVPFEQGIKIIDQYLAKNGNAFIDAQTGDINAEVEKQIMEEFRKRAGKLPSSAKPGGDVMAEFLLTKQIGSFYKAAMQNADASGEKMTEAEVEREMTEIVKKTVEVAERQGSSAQEADLAFKRAFEIIDALPQREVAAEGGVRRTPIELGSKIIEAEFERVRERAEALNSSFSREAKEAIVRDVERLSKRLSGETTGRSRAYEARLGSGSRELSRIREGLSEFRREVERVNERGQIGEATMNKLTNSREVFREAHRAGRTEISEYERGRRATSRRR